MLDGEEIDITCEWPGNGSNQMRVVPSREVLVCWMCMLDGNVRVMLIKSPHTKSGLV
jgi:hypothetical protein